MTFGILAAVCITLLTASSCGTVYPNRSLFNYICMLSENSYLSKARRVFISISSEYEVDVSMSSPFLSTSPFEEFTLNAGQGRKIAISPEIRMPVNSSVSARSILIQATKSVSVVLVNFMPTNFDEVHLMELDVLGTDYVVLSFVTTKPTSFIGIAVPFNETKINIRLPARVKPIDVFVNGRIFSTYPELTLTLQAYDALQILSGDDLTGTVISSDKKMAVFSGNTRTKVFGSCQDYMMEEMPRVSDIGNEYIVFSPHQGIDKDLLRLVALANDTAVTVDGGTTLNIEREFNFKDWRFSRRFVHHIRSTHPLLVGGITFSDRYTDASMWLIDPVPYTGYKYVFSIPKVGITLNTLVITIEGGQEGYLLFDGQPLSGSINWTDSAHSPYIVASIEVNPGNDAHVLQHTSAIGFGAALFGHHGCDCYSFRLTASSQPQECNSITTFRRHLEKRLVCTVSMRLLVANDMECHVACRSRYGNDCRGFNIARKMMHFGLECEICSSIDAGSNNEENYDFYTPII